MQGDFDFADLFTQVAREVAPLVRAKGLGLLFDYQGPVLRWHADSAPVGEALRRLCQAAIDILEDGFVFLTAQVSLLPQDRCGIAVAAAASGRFAASPVWREVLARLQLQGVERMGDQAMLEWRSARGTCPLTGGEVSFALDKSEGSLFSLQLALGQDLAQWQRDEPLPDAGGARAWLVGDVGALERRLQRLGWATRQLPDVDQAVRELERMPPGYSRPVLVVVFASADASTPDLASLKALLPAQARLVLAVASAGVPAPSGAEVRVQPFSPADLREFTEQAPAASPAVSGQTQPAPLAFDQRRRALVVDDNAVNQLVAGGMLQVLGFEVETACDGLEAIERCMRQAPDLVLMDLHMPGMDGLEATRRLRLLQREGALPRFPILAATADTTSQEACVAAGMDGHLPKPLDLAGLEHQLRRLMPC